MNCICCSFPTHMMCIGCDVPMHWECGECGLCPVCMILEAHRTEKRMPMPSTPPALILYQRYPWPGSLAQEKSNEPTEAMALK